MVSGLFHIQLNSSEENMDNGFFTLMTSGTSVTCLKDEEYIINKEALDKLRVEGIKYKEVEKNDISCAGEKTKNASTTKI